MTGETGGDFGDFGDSGDTIGGGGGGGGDSGDPHQQQEEAKDTPCVHYAPEGVDEHTLNNEAKYLGDMLAAKSASDGNEWGAFVYKTADGQLVESDPFTSGNPDQITGVSVSVPSGATIVGYIHTHPDDPMEDQRGLSDADRSFVSSLIRDHGADPDMLAYINTADESSDGAAHTYVFDKTHRSSTAGCDL